jgi:hypothetical protein
MIFPEQTFRTLVSVPERRFTRMAAQSILPWTPARLGLSAWRWLLAETGEQKSMKELEG